MHMSPLGQSESLLQSCVHHPRVEVGDDFGAIDVHWVDVRPWLPGNGARPHSASELPEPAQSLVQRPPKHCPDSHAVPLLHGA